MLLLRPMLVFPVQPMFVVLEFAEPLLLVVGVFLPRFALFELHLKAVEWFGQTDRQKRWRSRQIIVA
ncbi:hypothetical protein H6G17_14750 [Chroococcidiopsis sp. FACHB-1243]|nr:hypothetical protein [Chroococcidiopsis sp. [FACHB-1243]]